MKIRNLIFELTNKFNCNGDTDVLVNGNTNFHIMFDGKAVNIVTDVSKSVSERVSESVPENNVPEGNVPEKLDMAIPPQNFLGKLKAAIQ